MQIQIYKKGTNEIVAWLYVDCEEDKLIDAILHNDYEVKHGKTLKVKEEQDNGARR